MKFRLSSKWSIVILSLILNLHYTKCIADVNSRSRKSIQSEENLGKLSDDYDDNIVNADEQYNSVDDYEGADVDKRYTSLENKEHKNENNNNLIPESQKTIVQVAKRVADFELAKFELEKVEKNVENEILNLDKLYKTEKKSDKRQTNGIGKKSVKNNFNLKKMRQKSIATRSLNDIRRKPSSNFLAKSKKETPAMSNEEKIENAIQAKIDAIKVEVKRRIKAELEREMIKKINAKFDDLQRINRADTQSKNHNQLLETVKINEMKSGNRKVRKRSTAKPKKNKLTKLITKNINHHKMKKIKKSTHEPEKIFVDTENESPSEVGIQNQLTALKSKKNGNRSKRRFRKPPDDSKIQRRFSRRLRKPPGIELQSLKNQKNNYNRKNRHVINLKNSTANSNFLFRQNSQRKRSAILSDHIKQLALSQNEHGKSSKPKRNKRLMSYLKKNNDDFERKKERALNNLSNEINLNSVVNSNDLANMANSQDFSSSHLISQYEETFGDYNKNNRDDASLMRYKRVKRS